MEALKRYICNRLNRVPISNQKDILAMQYLAPLSQTYLPWTVMSMRPSGLVKVLNEIVINRRSCIVECGGSVSTFYIARLLKEKGGHLYTIEHDKEWVEVLQGLLAEQGLDKFVSVIFAPLVKTQLAVNAGSWYNESIIQKALATIKLDLLIVDDRQRIKRA
jgi:hypothetical protein